MTTELTVVNQPLFPSEQELSTLKDMAGTFVKSGLLPSSVNTPEKAILIMLKGRELGLPPLQALSGLHVIEGKPGLSSETMLAMIYKQVPGAQIQFVRSDTKGCEIDAARPGGKPQKFSFSEQDAQRAGLLGKQNWQKYPQSMYRARCISAMARAVFPDAIQNCHTPEELENADAPAPGETKAANISQALRSEPKEVVAEVVNIRNEPQVPNSVGSGFLNNVPIIAPKEQEATSPDQFDPIGDYEIKLQDPLLKGKRLKEVKPDALRKYLDQLNNHFKGKAITGVFLEFMTRAEEYLSTLDKPVDQEPSFESFQ